MSFTYKNIFKKYLEQGIFIIKLPLIINHKNRWRKMTIKYLKNIMIWNCITDTQIFRKKIVNEIKYLEGKFINKI